MSRPVFYSDDRYEIRAAHNVAEFKELWWRFMRELGWVSEYPSRRMNKSELTPGQNRGYLDIESYMNHSRSSGMLLLIDKTKGIPIGHVSAAVNSNNTGWISLFVVQSDARGKGLGRELFKAALKDAEDSGCNILGLDGVPEQKATYERRGFMDSPLGTVGAWVRPLVDVKPIFIAHDTPPGFKLVDIRDVPQHLLVEHELKYTGFERKKLWTDEHLFNRPDVFGYACVKIGEKIASVDDIQAWTLVRRRIGGFRVGPVYAADAESARAVLVPAMKKSTKAIAQTNPMPNEDPNDALAFAAEIYGANPRAKEFFQELGWTAVGFECHRMWLNGKATPQQSEGGAAQEGVFAVFDAAIG